ncbi:hypothetical protein BLNAU_24355 [Blattamonas nauphoetae]|uniref:Uncharacterized protein n=1 Tax=Blattamonas nauphoetae TaxID=2049346 RepID=A0ABQ9WPQ5_9EUKA|nr:hypothetical protein BLNAU_24355 [Blattamonas nauphoetae]
MESREQQTSGDIPPPIAYRSDLGQNMFIVGGVSLQTSETISTDDLFVLDLETLLKHVISTRQTCEWNSTLYPVVVPKSHQHSVAADTTIVLTREMPARGQGAAEEVLARVGVGDRVPGDEEARYENAVHPPLLPNILPTLTVKVECEYV